MNNEAHTGIKSYFLSGNMDKINEKMAVSKFEHKSNSDILMALVQNKNIPMTIPCIHKNEIR